MAREIAGKWGSKAYVLTTDDNPVIGLDSLSLRVVSERGARAQMPLTKDQALELAITLLQTVRGTVRHE